MLALFCVLNNLFSYCLKIVCPVSPCKYFMFCVSVFYYGCINRYQNNRHRDTSIAQYSKTTLEDTVIIQLLCK